MDDKTRDRRYRARYGITLEEYNQMLEAQQHACGICQRPKEMFTNNLSVDHDHAAKHIRVEVEKRDGVWFAQATYMYEMFFANSKRKHEAIRGVRSQLKRRANRGALCPFCNRGLKFYADDPTRLAAASEYLRKHQQEKTNENTQ